MVQVLVLLYKKRDFALTFLSAKDNNIPVFDFIGTTKWAHDIEMTSYRLLWDVITCTSH